MKLKKSLAISIAVITFAVINQIHAERIILHKQVNDTGTAIEPYFEVRHNSPAKLWLLYNFQGETVQVPADNLPKGLTLDEKSGLLLYGNEYGDYVACGTFDQDGNVTLFDYDRFGHNDNESSCKVGVTTVKDPDGQRYSEIYLDYFLE